MNTKNFEEKLNKLQEIDFKIKTLDFEKKQIKAQITKTMEAESRDEYLSSTGTKATLIHSTREMYIKKSLEKYVDKKTLNKCKKTIEVKQMRITYAKEK